MNKFFKSLLLMTLIPTMLLAGECDVACHQGKITIPSKTQVYKEDWIKEVARFIKMRSSKTTEIMIFEEDQIIIVNIQTGDITYIFDTKD